MDTKSDDFFDDHDYLPPGSPALLPFRPDLIPQMDISRGQVRDRDLNFNPESDEEDLDINIPWVFGVTDNDGYVPRSKKSLLGSRKRQKQMAAQGDRVLLRALGGDKSTWKIDRGQRARSLLSETETDDDDDSSDDNSDADNVPKQQWTQGLTSNPRTTNPTGKQPLATRIRKRLTLPLVLYTTTGPVHVTGCPDTGSEDNIISLELVKRLDLPVKPVDTDTRMFSLANRKLIKAVGQTSLRYTFGGDKESNILSECIAYVFETLVVPLITGAQFLTETKIFTERRELLVEEMIPMMQSLRVNSVGKPKQSLVCRLDTFVGCANADTGSDLDLISPDFAKSRAMKIESTTEKLQFADGSISYTSGIIKTSFAVGVVDTVRGFVQSGETLNLAFFVLDSLTSDVLVGQDTLEELKVFMEHGQSLLSIAPSLGLSDCSIIRHIGSIETKLSKVADLATRVVDMALRRPGTIEEAVPHPPSPSGCTLRTERQNLIDIQRENARLEESDKSAADVLIRMGDGVAMDFPRVSRPAFTCTFPACTSPPFYTQYLLNSHSNVHSSAGPYCCPVSGCPRAEGGKGFRRRGEMLRHGLLHSAPGYVCPFFPDSEHKYLMPDTLQRHVRVHHIDIDKDDPRLRAVLSQRPE